MADYSALAKEVSRRRAKKPIVPQQPGTATARSKEEQRALFIKNVLKR